MDALRRLRAKIFILLAICSLVGMLLWIGKGITNPYAFDESYQISQHRLGGWGGRILNSARAIGVIGLYQHLKGESLVQVSEDQVHLMNTAIQGQNKYLEILRLQLAMQHMKYDFLEKDFLLKQEELDKLLADSSNTRAIASE